MAYFIFWSSCLRNGCVPGTTQGSGSSRPRLTCFARALIRIGLCRHQGRGHNCFGWGLRSATTSTRSCISLGRRLTRYGIDNFAVPNDSGHRGALAHLWRLVGSSCGLRPRTFGGDIDASLLNSRNWASELAPRLFGASSQRNSTVRSRLCSASRRPCSMPYRTPRHPEIVLPRSRIDSRPTSVRKFEQCLLSGEQTCACDGALLMPPG